MTDANTMVERLEDENYRGAFQHLRSWCELDQMHSEAAALIRSQQEEIAVLRNATLEEAATLAETFWELRDLDWWLKSTKKEISASMCDSIAAAIRASAAGGREG